MSCSSCTPSAAPPATPRRWSRPRPCCSPATPSTGARPTTRSTTRPRTRPGRSGARLHRTPNASADGQAATLAYLKYLANHPATARNLCRKLATYFVSDTPSDRAGRLARRGLPELGHQHRGGAEGPRRPPGVPHLRRPQGAYAGRRPRRHRPRPRRRRARRRTTATPGPTHANYVHGSDRIFSWPRPDGPPITGAAVVLGVPAVRVATTCTCNQAGGWWPQGRHLPHRRLLAADGVTALRRLRRPPVPHLARSRRDARLLHGGVPGRSSPRRHADHAEARRWPSWMFPRLAIALLDSPDHMTT